MRQRVLGVLPLPAPVDEGDGEERAPEEDVGDGDDEEHPQLGRALPPRLPRPRQVAQHAGLAGPRPHSSHLNIDIIYLSVSGIRRDGHLLLEVEMYLQKGCIMLSGVGSS